MINTRIFKSNDIRGVYPDELNEKTAEQIGRAFVGYTAVKKIIIGKDVRLSSPSLFRALAKGIIGSGADVYDIGTAPTECVYFAIAFGDFDGGIMITASHNPKEYNGLKILKKENNDIFIVRGKDMLEAVKKPPLSFCQNRKGKIKKMDIWQDYLNHIFSFADFSKIKPFKIVIDAGNGAAGIVVEKIKSKLPVKIIPLNFKPDGNFPNRPPNPLLEGAVNEISGKIKKEKADFGFMFDGDADRVFLIDEKGGFVRADIALLFLAKYFLKKNPKAGIAYNTICSKAVPQFIKKWGGRPIRTKVGFVNVREAMLKNKGVVGGELSGHYAFADNFFLDSGFIAFLVLLKIISESNKKVSEMAEEFSVYAKSAEINFEVKDKQEIIEAAKKRYSEGKQDYLDGLTAEYDNWWFNLRASNTEPLLRLTIEADTERLLKKKKKELIDFIQHLSTT